MGDLNIKKDFPLKDLTTFGIGGKAKYFAEVSSESGLKEAVTFVRKNKCKVFILGGGSDILLSDKGFSGLVIKLKEKKIKTKDLGKNVLVTSSAGVNWDDLVSFSVENDLQGIECLSGIPGTVGASPVQNIGAYGQELKDTFYRLKAYDTKKGDVVKLGNTDCGFSYRESIFKKPKNKGRYIILEVSLLLRKNTPPEIKYDSLKNYFKERGLKNPGLSDVRMAVLDVRRGKFENPEEVGNAGSFFKNPIIDKLMMSELRKKYVDVPCYDNGDGSCKVFAGWFIEKAGLKGFKMGNAAVSAKHALVIVNPEGKAASEDVKKLANKIISDVKNMFGIKLEREVQYVD